MPDDIASIPAVRNDVADAALAGLLQPRKTLPARLFYDEAGCRLFQAITQLPEYYLTRTERALLSEVAPRVAADQPGPAVLVEYGGSDEAKAEFLLRESRPDGDPVFRAYVPIDVAASALLEMQIRLRRKRPDLLVRPIAADFLEPVILPDEVVLYRRLGFFPGSTIGNLDPPTAQRLLRQARQTLGDGARFLVGVDVRKDPAILLPAYDDAAGVTAAFNLNLLTRLNREAEADFDLDMFAHRVVWNSSESRIEMHLESRRDQTVHVAGMPIAFAEGETIHTENSYKYAPDQFQRIAAGGGWRVANSWMDRDRLFSLHLLES